MKEYDVICMAYKLNGVLFLFQMQYILTSRAVEIKLEPGGINFNYGPQ